MKWRGLWPYVRDFLHFVFLGERGAQPPRCTYVHMGILGRCQSGPTPTCGAGMCAEHHHQHCAHYRTDSKMTPDCWMPPGIPPSPVQAPGVKER